MSLILTIINQSKPGQEISKVFETEGTIGRALKNNWVLIDPNRFISSQHARIHFDNNNYYITDLSTNGLFINRSKQPLGKGNSVALKQGDVITIGEYEISVSVQTSQQIPSQDQSPFGITPPAPSSGEFPFQPPEPSMPPLAEPPLSKSISSDIEPDEQVDPLAMFNKPDQQPGAPLRPPSDSASLDDLLNPKGNHEKPPANGTAGAVANHAPPLQQHFQPPQMIPEDWDLPSSDKQPPKAKAQEQIPPLDFEQKFAPQPSPDENLPPLDFAPAPEPKPAPRPQARPATPAVSESAVLQSLLTGLHMKSLPVAREEIPNFTRTVGEVARVSIQGMLTALRARSSIKSEFRMSMTTIKAKENNPLKFSVTLEDAMNNMFQNQSNSYLPPTQAMLEGFNDLEAHMIAVMAGMQVALTAVLRRFDPANLEQDFEKRQGGFATMLPGGKKAKHWDAYLEHYKDIIASAEDDFQTFFGDEFTRAYEEQVRKLKQSRNNKT